MFIKVLCPCLIGLFGLYKSFLQKLFSLMLSHLIIFALVAFAFSIKSDVKNSEDQYQEAIFSSRNFKILGHMFKSLF